MAEHKAKVVLSNRAYKIINWLTHNYDKEIGAVGVGTLRKNPNDEEMHIYVEDLYFPKQTVSTATVHITQEGWARIIQQVPSDRWGDICFYWHKHPGNSPNHSGVDEEDTFETFMAPEAKRPWFAFLQTAKDGDDDMNIELRIEIREPMRATLLGASCTKLRFEVSNDEKKVRAKIDKLQDKIDELRDRPDEDLKEEMETMIDEVVEKKTTNNYWNNQKGGWRGKTYGQRSTPKEDSEEEDKIMEDLKLLWEKDDKEGEYIDNSTLMGMSTSDKEQASLKLKDGCVIVKAGALFKIAMDSHLKKGGKLHSVVKRFTHDKPKTVTMHSYILQPHKKGYDDLVLVIKRLFISYNDAILKNWENKGVFKQQKQKQLITVISKTDKKKEIDVGANFKVNDKDMIEDILMEIDFYGDLTWSGSSYATMRQKGSEEIMGSLIVNHKAHTIFFTGEDVVYIAKRVVHKLEHEKQKGGKTDGTKTKTKRKTKGKTKKQKSKKARKSKKQIARAG